MLYIDNGSDFTSHHTTMVNGAKVEIYEENIHIDPTTGLLFPGGSDLVLVSVPRLAQLRPEDISPYHLINAINEILLLLLD